MGPIHDILNDRKRFRRVEVDPDAFHLVHCLTISTEWNGLKTGVVSAPHEMRIAFATKGGAFHSVQNCQICTKWKGACDNATKTDYGCCRCSVKQTESKAGDKEEYENTDDIEKGTIDVVLYVSLLHRRHLPFLLHPDSFVTLLAVTRCCSLSLSVHSVAMRACTYLATQNLRNTQLSCHSTARCPENNNTKRSALLRQSRRCSRCGGLRHEPSSPSKAFCCVEVATMVRVSPICTTSRGW